MRNVTQQLLAALLVLGLLAGCGVSHEVYRGDVGRLRNQISNLERTGSALLKEGAERAQRLEAMARMKTNCERELAALRSQGGQLGAELRGALDRIRELEAAMSRQQEVFDSLTRALDSLVKAGKLQVRIVRGQFTVQMSDKILFDPAQWKLKAGAAETLRELTRILASVPGRRYEVAGHTDSDGPEKMNWKLSANRSLSVALFMIKEGMPPERLTFAGAGEFQPAAPNDTPENKAQNRRIEIVLVPDLEALLAPLRKK